MSPQNSQPCDPQLAAALETVTRLERQLREAQKMEAVGLLTGGIAHDFNNLLAVVNGYSDMLLTGPELPEEARKFIGNIQQALLNLVVNSRDAMPEGGKLEVQTANLELDAAPSKSHPDLPAGNYILLTVSDTGTGMDDETKQHLFEPLYTTKAPGAGTGLGLLIVQHIVKQSGGFLFVRSEKGDGTTVSIYLPCFVGEKSPEISGLQKAPPRGHEKILIVDDSPEVRRVLHRMLEGLGYFVLEAASAREAVALSSGLADGSDLLVVDVELADSTGVELAQRLREPRPELPVLYVSGYPQGAAIEGVQESGAEFLSKPFTLVAFAERVRRILDRRKPRRILFVDDDADVVLFASLVLRNAGFEVLVGGNGDTALSMVEIERPDLVITDLVMPERGGLATIMTLRKLHPSLPVIATSGAFGGYFLEAAVTLGAHATLPKPFSGEELLEAVRVVLCRQSASMT